MRSLTMKTVPASSKKLKRSLVVIVLCLITCIILLVEINTSVVYDIANYVPKALQCFSDGAQNRSHREERKLEVLAIDPRVWLRYKNKTWKGLRLPVITTAPAGRFGNVMGEYATLYGVGKIYNVTVRLHPDAKSQLADVFPNLTMPLVPGKVNLLEWTQLNYWSTGSYGGIEAAAAGVLGPHLFVSSGYPFEIQLFNAYRNDILKEFTFSRILQEKVHNFWKAQKNFSEALVRVGFHIRRTDYVHYIKTKQGHLPDQLYFGNAMEYYRTRFPKVLFVVASDDMAFARKALSNYTDVIYAPGISREEDMAILTSCNHSIITLGSFGFWTGYLAGGLVVYPNITSSYNYPFQRERYEMSGLDSFVMVQSD